MRNVQIGLIVDFSKLIFWWESISSGELLWLSLGLGAQAMFSTRFIIQWIASERAKKSIVPEAFWYFSFVGGFMLFMYALHRMDPVFIIGQGTGLFIYSRNIYLIWKNKVFSREKTLSSQTITT
ncbi:MAG: lipid-A-disaccharide synthase N-terminal domain-containing protein [Rhodomicrobiaceae bacterium]|jgi:lipid-A-disaccharide synthase-like uncharacterized protein